MRSTKRRQRHKMQKMQKQKSAMEETGTHPLKHPKTISIQNGANPTFIFGA
jgi:hypothetical protein